MTHLIKQIIWLILGHAFLIPRGKYLARAQRTYRNASMHVTQIDDFVTDVRVADQDLTVRRKSVR